MNVLTPPSAGLLTHLPGLRGLRAVDALAAWGLLAVLSEPIVGAPRAATLRWTKDQLNPHATLVSNGNLAMDQLVDRLDVDRQAWLDSPVLARDDIVMSFGEAARWAEVVAGASPPEVRLWRSLISLDPLLVSRGGKGNVAYCSLRFVAGRQRFLQNARQLAEQTTNQHIRSALTEGTERAELPSLRWDERDDQPPATAVHRVDRLVGKEWLAWRGLTAMPPVDGRHRFGVEPAEFLWPLNANTGGLSLDDIRRLLIDPRASLGDLPYGRAAITSRLGSHPAYKAFGGAAIYQPGVGPIRDPAWRDRDVAHLVGVKSVCELVGGIKASTWRAYVARGQAPMPVERIGRTPMWDREEVWSWHLARNGLGWRRSTHRDSQPIDT